MRMIWLKSDYVDPPDTGGKLRTYNLLRELNKRCEVTYVSLTSERKVAETEKADWASRIVTFFRAEEKKSGIEFYLRLLARMFSMRPYIVQKYQCRAILDVQKQTQSTPENGKPTDRDQTVLICDFLEMAGNVVWSTPWPKVLFQHNVESVIWRRYVETEPNWLKRTYFRFECRRLTRYERDACNRFDLVLAVSERDRETFQAMGVTTPIEVIETGVDTQFFAPQPDVKSPSHNRPRSLAASADAGCGIGSKPIPNRLLFLGSLDWMPNIDGLKWFMANIYPIIKKKCPEVTLDIVGRRPIPYIAELPTKDSSIRVIADVPDVRPYLASADLFVVPLRVGSGTRLKIFEAMAMGCPVVSTTIGAEGLPLTPDENVVLADSPGAFAEQVGSLLKDPGKKKAIAESGYRLVTEKYSWSKVSQRMYDVCADTLGTTASDGK